MAKTRSRQPDAASKRTEEAIDRLKTYYELGRKALQLAKSIEGPYAPGVITRLAKETGENKATVNKCKQFAEMYSPAEFKELCKLRRPNGKPIGWGHVTKLLTVPQAHKQLRKKLQTQAANDGWTARRLNDEIHGRIRVLVWRHGPALEPAGFKGTSVAADFTAEPTVAAMVHGIGKRREYFGRCSAR